MRLNVYKQINEMLSTLMEAINYMLESDNPDIIIQLLEDSKLVIDSIDLSLTQNSESIKDPKIFEQIRKCREMIMKIFESNSILNKECLHFLDNAIKDLQIIFRKSVQYKIRVVFFAELGQKWDSMNSVYRAFMKRDDCDVRVVLTPIFRKVNVNGKTKTDVIYDDYLTELGIEFMHYKEYDISKDLPDIAFISNPYESVTIRDYWPENIAKYTRLVYLPYFTGLLADEIFINSFFKLNINNYAWKIVAQSEKMSKLQSIYGNGNTENLLFTGLPKWDEDIKKIEKINVDKSWLDKTEGKKVFLWNSHYNVDYHYSTLLEYGEDIVNFFEDRDDLALIWRPHPMTETIFNLYKPEQKTFYDNLTDKVKSSKNMLLDTNTTYTQSFYLSDALISDYSSMIVQYLLTEKPVLWLKKKATSQNLSGLEQIVDLDAITEANQFNDIVQFVNEISTNHNYVNEINVKEFLGGITEIDGKIGERVCENLINELIKEELTLY